VYADEVGNEGEYGFQVSATDSAGNSATQACSIESGNNPPVVSVSCPSSVRVDHDYDCYLNAYDPDGDEVTYDSVSGLPPGITHSSGHITGAPASSGDYTIEVNTSDPFGESASASYNLSVDTYCGDGAVQDPNDEGVSEECDNGEDNGQVCEPGYDEPCQYCSNSCQWISKAAPGECGNGIVETEYGEDCDPPNEDDNCNGNCHWGCFNYDENVSLSFAEGSQAQLAKDESTTLTLPACTGVKDDSFKVDIEMIDVSSNNSMGVVFVTDTSGSMSGEMGDVKEAIKNSIDQLNNELNNPTKVGLVEFNSSIGSTIGPLELNSSNIVSLKNEIDTYSAGGGTYADLGIEEAHSMLNDGNYDTSIIVVLTDGVSNGTPQESADNAKDDGIEMYTIAYGSAAPDMESWATDSSYAYSGSNADQVYNDITESIVASPEGDIDVIVNGDVNTIEAENDTNVSLSGVTCDPDHESLINFSNNFEQGEVRYSNPRIDICTIDNNQSHSKIDSNFISGIKLSNLENIDEINEITFSLASDLGVDYVHVPVTKPMGKDIDEITWAENLNYEQIFSLAEEYNIEISPAFYKLGGKEDSNAEKYAEFVISFLDEFYDGKNISFVEFQNEPVKEYDPIAGISHRFRGTPAELAATHEAAHNKIKAEYPEIKTGAAGFIATAVNSEENRLMNMYYEQYLKAAPPLDVFNLHHYPRQGAYLQTQTGGEEYNFLSEFEIYDFYRDLLADNGYFDTPLLITEGAVDIPALMGESWTAGEAQNFLAQKYSLAYEKGVTGSFVSGIKGNLETNLFSYNNGDYEVTRRFQFYKELLDFTDDYPIYNQRLHGEADSSDYWLEEFQNSNGQKAWLGFCPVSFETSTSQDGKAIVKSKTSDCPQQVTLNIPYDVTITKIDPTGSVSVKTVSSESGRISFKIDERPVFIEKEKRLIKIQQRTRRKNIFTCKGLFL
jgi:uncharacterized protein YegL